MRATIRSSTRDTEGNGGQRNTLGYTDHNLIKSSGMIAVPVATCRPWVNR